MTLSDMLSIFLIALLITDLTVHWLAERRMRESARQHEKIARDPVTIIIECDNSQAMAKLAEVTAAAHIAADALGRLH